MGIYDTASVDTAALEDLQVAYQLLGTTSLPDSTLTAQVEAQLIQKTGISISPRLATWLIRNQRNQIITGVDDLNMLDYCQI